jgi:hypothetical protein
MVSKLTKIYPLPGPQVQSSVCYRNSHGAPNDRSLQMSRHIIRSFINMRIKGVILRYEVVYKGFKIKPHRWVSILIQGKARRSMLNQYMHDSGIGQYACCLYYLACDQVKSPWMGRQCERMLSGHG